MHARDIWSWSPYLHWHQNDFRINLKRIIFNIMSRLNAFFFFFAAAFFLSIFCGYKLKKKKNLKIVCAIDDDEILVFLDIFMSASDMNFLEQLKITMANLMGIDDDSQNKKKCFFAKNMIRSKEMMQLKFKKGSHERYCGCQWIRFQFCNVSMIGSLSQNPQLHRSVDMFK